MNTHVLAQTKPATMSAPPVRSNLLQRKCACGGTAGPTGQCEECREKGESKNYYSSEIPPIVHEVLNSPGQPLDAGTRAFMEPRFGHDFSNVRVHTDAKSADSARAVHAHAYTVGQDVVFSEHKYAPATHAGRELLAHELAHAIQQRSVGAPPPSQEPSGVFESSASAAGRGIANGGAISQDFPACGIGLARAPVMPSDLNDQQLAEELKRATEKLKSDEQPGWWLEQLRAETQRRANLRAQAERDQAQRAAAKRERKERAEAIAEAEAIAKAPSPAKDENEDEELPVTPMALDSGIGKRSQSKPASPPARRPPRKNPPRAPWETGDAIIERLNKEIDESNKRLDERIDKERRIGKRPYWDRLNEVRRRLRDVRTQYRLLTAEQVWEEGIKNDLFLEREKKAVYEDQGGAQKDLEKEDEHIRVKFQYEQQQRRDQFYQNLQLAPIQATLMGGAGGFAQAANLGTRAIAAGKVISGAYTTYTVADTTVQIHRAATTGSPADVVGAVLPVAGGLVFGHIIGGGGGGMRETGENPRPVTAPSVLRPRRPAPPPTSEEVGGARGGGRVSSFDRGKISRPYYLEDPKGPTGLPRNPRRSAAEQKQYDLAVQNYRKDNPDGIRVIKDPTQKHHVASDKSSEYTPQFKKLFEDAGMERGLRDYANLVSIEGHKNAHGPDYHRAVLGRLKDAVKGKDPGSAEYREAFLAELARLKAEVARPGSYLNSLVRGNK